MVIMADLLDFKKTQSDSAKEQGAALQRLLDLKGPVRRQHKEESDFLSALDEILALIDAADDQSAGWLDGSVSGQCWQDFMDTLRIDLLTRLQHYRDEARRQDFSPASLMALKTERQRIERLYVRDLVAVYHSAAQTYKTLSG